MVDFSNTSNTNQKSVVKNSQYLHLYPKESQKHMAGVCIREIKNAQIAIKNNKFESVPEGYHQCIYIG